MEYDKIDELLKELLIELRWLGCRLSSFCDAKYTISHISNIKDIYRKIEPNNPLIKSRLDILSKETGWNMNKLFDICLAFPKITPRLEDIKSPTKDKLLLKNDSTALKYFGSKSPKAYIAGNEIKLELIDDYGQEYDTKLIFRINKYLEHLDIGIEKTLSYIRSSKDNGKVRNIIDEYLTYCNKYFTHEVKELVFENPILSKECFLDKLNVKKVWIFVDGDNIEFYYDVLFWEKFINRCLCVIEDEDFNVKGVELEDFER